MRRVSSPLFVGRSSELAALREAVGAALRAEARAVVVGGEAGVGKTRLIAELAALVEPLGVRVLVGACTDVGGASLPLAPFVEALRPLLRELPVPRLAELLGGPRSELARVLPGLPESVAPVTELHPAHQAPALPPDRFAQARLFEFLVGFLEDLSDDHPTVLVIEDLHWADASTRECLAFLVRNLGAARLVLVVTYRTDELHRRHPLRSYLADLDRGGRVERLILERFDLEELRQQVDAITGSEVAPELVATLFERSEGNPFFAEEILSTLGEGEPRRLPESLRDVLLRRTDALAEPARRMLRVAAVAGRRVEEWLLAAVLKISEEELLGALREAIDHHVLVPEQDLASKDRYSFRHALLQEALYEDLLGGERSALHRAVGEALERRRDAARREHRADDGRLDPSLDALLAFHWERGGRPDRALVAAVRAAESAGALYAFTDAVAGAERALELWDQVDDAPEDVPYDRVTLLHRASSAARAAGQHRRAVALLRRAILEIDADRDPLRAATLHADLMTQLFGAGDETGAERERQEALRLAPPDPPTLERAHVLNRAVYPLLFASRYVEARTMSEEAVAIAQQLAQPAVEGPARSTLGMAVAFLGDVKGGLGHLERSLALARRHKDPYLLSDAFLGLGIVLEAAGRFEEAIDRMHEALDALREVGMGHAARATLETDLAEALRRAGRWVESEAIAGRDPGPEATGWELGNRHAVRAHLLVATGRLTEAAASLEAAGRAFEAMPATGFAGLLFSARAEHAFRSGDVEAARTWVREGLERVGRSGDLRWIGELTVLGLRLEADRVAEAAVRRRSSDIERARVDGDALLVAFREATRRGLEAGTIFADEAKGYLATAEAEARRLHGVLDPDAWRTATERWHELGQPYPEAYAAYRAGEAILDAGGERGDAATLLERAHALAAGTGARPLLAEIEGLAARARLRIRPSAASAAAGSTAGADANVIRAVAPTGGAALTPREREVLELLARGWSDRHIARALFISPKTASVHVSNIKGKLGVEHRLEAATAAVRLGLVRPPQPPRTGRQESERRRSWYAPGRHDRGSEH